MNIAKYFHKRKIQIQINRLCLRTHARTPHACTQTHIAGNFCGLKSGVLTMYRQIFISVIFGPIWHDVCQNLVMLPKIGPEIQKYK